MNTLFNQPLKVVNAGLAGFANNIQKVGGDAIALSWQPPALGNIDGPGSGGFAAPPIG